MANMTFGVNILPKSNAVTIGNSDHPWSITSPSLTGVPTAPTATSGTNTTQIATTAFVQSAVSECGGLITVSSAISIPSSGSSATYSISGITADYQLVAWNFSTSAENYPPADLTWTTGNGTFTVQNTSGTTSETIKPVFGIPVAKTATTM